MGALRHLIGRATPPDKDKRYKTGRGQPAKRRLIQESTSQVHTHAGTSYSLMHDPYLVLAQPASLSQQQASHSYQQASLSNEQTSASNQETGLSNQQAILFNYQSHFSNHQASYPDHQESPSHVHPASPQHEHQESPPHQHPPSPPHQHIASPPHQHPPSPSQHPQNHNLDFTSCASLRVLTDRPKRPDLAPKNIRLQTFSQWREDHHIKVNDLVEAGFYYGGYADCGRCFYCGGGLKNWGDQDDLLVEHARWFPKCGFIRQKMGEDFVDTVQELNQHAVEIPFNMVVEEMKRKHLHNVIEETTLSRDPAVQAVVDLGYDRQDVLQAAEECVQTEEGFVLSADVILNRLPVKPCTDTQHLPSNEASKTNFTDAMQKMKETNRQLRQQTLCKVCLDRDVQIVFLPCGHLVSCLECSFSLTTCPVCRSKIKGVIRAHIT